MAENTNEKTKRTYSKEEITKLIRDSLKDSDKKVIEKKFENLKNDFQNLFQIYSSLYGYEEAYTKFNIKNMLPAEKDKIEINPKLHFLKKETNPNTYALEQIEKDFEFLFQKTYLDTLQVVWLDEKKQFCKRLYGWGRIEFNPVTQDYSKRMEEIFTIKEVEKYYTKNLGFFGTFDEKNAPYALLTCDLRDTNFTKFICEHLKRAHKVETKKESLLVSCIGIEASAEKKVFNYLVFARDHVHLSDSIYGPNVISTIPIEEPNLTNNRHFNFFTPEQGLEFAKILDFLNYDNL